MGFGLVLTAVLAAMFGVFVVHVMPPLRRTQIHSPFFEASPGATFLFDGETLIDSSPSARAILSAQPGRSPAWARLMSYLAGRFPGVDTALLRLPHEGVVALTSDPARGDPLLFQAELRGGLTRISLIDPEDDHDAPRGDAMNFRAMSDEVSMLRDMVARAPVLVWRQTSEGEVYWANPAYMAVAAARLGEGQELTWPLPQLFDPLASKGHDLRQRQKLIKADGGALWFEMSGFPDGSGQLCFAMYADATVQAETALRDFMQTLTKTFAQLHVGLAIFDSSRQLQLFNPALLDLTDLPVDFLSARPSLTSVLDAMRDHNMIPEPKDYRSWRRQLLELEKAASTGLYEETWSLPGGQTYRVIGRPHPNGALALMIEDISSEMLRTRRYRADLELSQAVLDQMEKAVAVFSDGGQLVLSNTAYSRLWGHDPSSSPTEAGIALLCRHWRENSAPSQIWSAVESFATNTGDRLEWTGEARLADGRLVDCCFTPLHGGATMASFRLADLRAVPAVVEAAEQPEAEDLALPMRA